MRLLPREEKFFDQFEAQASLILKASSVLAEACRKGPEALPQAAMRIDELERQGDTIVREIFTRLNQTFITPLDPEDIHQLGSHLDDCLDLLEDTVHCLDAYEIAPIPPEVQELCDLTEKCATSLAAAFGALSKDKPIIEFCRQVDALEEQADHVHRRAVAALFKTTDAIRVMKLKEILDLLESTTDACEDVADVLQTVVVKNS
ncbi:DUF47 domain-containing protein [Bryobacter aggregatus]|uniref:DUF47 domain-containing protein n=1 Tax=Bryobacter aggregatus TaxID=360054 RepID=UPI0004E121CE|nr:DUF47 family protein [Bryobacter aggregatus]